MTNYLLIFLASLLFAMGGTPLVRLLAIRVGVVDQPAARKLHTSPIPLLGGVAIYASVCAALLLFSDQFYVAQLNNTIIWLRLKLEKMKVHQKASIQYGDHAKQNLNWLKIYQLV